MSVGEREKVDRIGREIAREQEKTSYFSLCDYLWVGCPVGFYLHASGSL